MSDSEDEFIMLDSAICKYFIMKNSRIRTCCAHPINTKRWEFGEFHHLYEDLRLDDERFFGYMRMRIETFDYICSKVHTKLDKKWNNCHARPILSEERLMLTFR